MISGVTGQLGYYLVKLLIEKDYDVIGLYRRTATRSFDRLYDFLNLPNFELVPCDITDATSVFRVVDKYKPEEIYNTAAQSYVHVSFTEPAHTFNVDTIGVLNFLEAIRILKTDTKFITMSTSEMFGKSVSYQGLENFNGCDVGLRHNTFIKDAPEGVELFQDEETPFFPQSPYGIAKLASHHLVRLYREAYNIFACSNINYNFESPHRGKEFVTRKITDYVAQIATGRIANEKLPLGNLDAKRDWGFAGDVAKATWLTLQQDNPDEYVVSTMKTHSIKDLCKVAFGCLDLDYEDYVVVDPKFFRPAEVDYLLGDSTKIRQKLEWNPSTSFEDLIQYMVDSDIMIYNGL